VLSPDGPYALPNGGLRVLLPGVIIPAPAPPVPAPAPAPVPAPPVPAPAPVPAPPVAAPAPPVPAPAPPALLKEKESKAKATSVTERETICMHVFIKVGKRVLSDHEQCRDADALTRRHILTERVHCTSQTRS
jgi:hypothetical protein